MTAPSISLNIIKVTGTYSVAKSPLSVGLWEHILFVMTTNAQS